MKTSPKISVITPAYNAAQHIRATIDSVLSQTEQDFELLIINDGSTDDTEKIVREYDSPKIVYHTNPQNLGIAKTYNRALQLARGKYLAIAESDDISHPQRLEVQANFLRNNQNVGAVSAKGKMFSGQPPKLREVPTDAPIAKSPKHCHSSVLSYGPAIKHPISMLCADTLRNNQIRYNENCAVAFDVQLFIDILRVSDLIELNCTLLAYRIHPNNFSIVNKTRGLVEALEAVTHYINSTSQANINLDWFDNAQIKNANLFTALTDEIQILVDEKSADPTYDPAALTERATQFLYGQLLGLAKADAAPRDIFNCYRRAKLVRTVNLERKVRLAMKSLRRFT